MHVFEASVRVRRALALPTAVTDVGPGGGRVSITRGTTLEVGDNHKEDTDLLRHIMSAGELGCCCIGTALGLGLDDELGVAMASFFEPSAGGRVGDNCASGESPSAPSKAEFFCLFFFLAILNGVSL